MSNHKSDKRKSSERIEKAKKLYNYQIKMLEVMCPFSKYNIDGFNPTEYGNRVRICREKLRLTQAECGESAGMSGAELSKIELGKVKKLNRDHLYLLCSVMNVTPDYLLGLVEDSREIIISSPKGSDKKMITMIDLDNHVIKDIGYLISFGYMLSRKNYAKYPEVYTKLSDILRSSDKPGAMEELLAAVNSIYERYKIEPYVGDDW